MATITAKKNPEIAIVRIKYPDKSSKRFRLKIKKILIAENIIMTNDTVSITNCAEVKSITSLLKCHLNQLSQLIASMRCSKNFFS